MHQIVEFYQYNSEVRKRYLEAIEKLKWDEVIKDRGASFHSIRNVFLHVLDAYRYWFQHGIHDNLKDYQRIDHASFNNVDEMRKYEAQVDSLVLNLVNNLKEEDLSRIYAIRRRDGVLQVTMEALLMHLIEEELQHRGEINCMLWQEDVDPPITQFHEWLQEKEEPAKAS